MRLLQFLSSHQIAYRPATFRVLENGSKELLETLPDSPYVLHDTSNVWVVDVDFEGYTSKLLEVCPWYLSVHKRLPHILFRSSTSMDVPTCPFQGDHRIDLLCGRWAFAHVDEEVHNAESLPVLDGVALCQNKLMYSLRKWVLQSTRTL
jgi:hypothetical protein